ncbi:MAG TPA: PKD domain-containing protein [Candidatus Binatia bacterium]|nr:PKD domain-containing protein [Candidatus Binatia bacterium]
MSRIVSALLAVGLAGCQFTSCGETNADREEAARPSSQRPPSPLRLTLPTAAQRFGRTAPAASTFERPEKDAAGDAPEPTPRDSATPTAPIPEIDIEADPDIGRAPLTVRFRVATADAIEEHNCEWTFDDATPPVHGQATTHTYTQAGQYTAHVTVTFADGRQTSKDSVIQVDEPEQPEATDSD